MHRFSHAAVVGWPLALCLWVADVKVWTEPEGVSEVSFYHKPVKHCDDDNGCATIYNVFRNEVENHTDCVVSNTSNTMTPFLGWITSDEFTQQPARHLGYDRVHDCDLWEHISRRFYPKPFNETVCVRQATAVNPPLPIYKHWTEDGKPGSSTRWSGMTHHDSRETWPAPLLALVLVPLTPAWFPAACGIGRLPLHRFST